MIYYQFRGTKRVDQKSSLTFYRHIFFDLMDITCVSSYLIFNMKHPNKLSLPDYKMAVAKNLIQYRQGLKRAVSMSRSFKRKKQSELIDILEDIYQINKQGENDVHTVLWRVKKIGHSSSVWFITKKETASKSITFGST